MKIILIAALMMAASSMAQDLKFDFVENTSPSEEVINILKNKKHVILDSRSKEAFDSLHIDGSVHLDYSTFLDSEALSVTKLVPAKDTPICILNEPEVSAPKPIHNGLKAIGYSNLLSANVTSMHHLLDKDIPLAGIDKESALNWKKRLINVDEFAKKMKHPDTVVLDVQMHDHHKNLSVRDSIFLEYKISEPHITEDEVTKAIPDKNTAILLFQASNSSSKMDKTKPTQTYTQLWRYGYHNVYMLDQFLAATNEKIPLIGLSTKR